MSELRRNVQELLARYLLGNENVSRELVGVLKTYIENFDPVYTTYTRIMDDLMEALLQSSTLTGGEYEYWIIAVRLRLFNSIMFEEVQGNIVLSMTKSSGLRPLRHHYRVPMSCHQEWVVGLL